MNLLGVNQKANRIIYSFFIILNNYLIYLELFVIIICKQVGMICVILIIV